MHPKEYRYLINQEYSGYTRVVLAVYTSTWRQLATRDMEIQPYQMLSQCGTFLPPPYDLTIYVNHQYASIGTRVCIPKLVKALVVE